jgi:hypothetical protein
VDDTPVEGTAADPRDQHRLVWRVPPALPAVLLLLVSGAAALNIYGHPSQPVRLFTIGLGLICLVVAIGWLRMYLVADEDGVEVRELRRVSSIEWPEIDRVEVVYGVRGGNTVRVTRHDGSFVDVPPSLLQPARPTSKPRAEAQLKMIAREIEQLRGRTSS